MSNETIQITTGISHFTELNSQQLFDAVSMHLSKAEALAVVAVTNDFEAYLPETLTNYLWALSDLIRDVKVLYKKLGEILDLSSN